MRQTLCFAALLLALCPPGLRADDAPAALSPTAEAKHVDASAALLPPAPSVNPAAVPLAPAKHVDAAAVLEKAAPSEPVTSQGALYKAAVWPGLFWHGAGYSYAGDSDMALGLTGLEGFSVFVTGFAGYEWAFVQGSAGENKDTAAALTWGGGALFLAGWVWDMVGSSMEAGQKGHGAPQVGLLPIRNGAALSVRF